MKHIEMHIHSFSLRFQFKYRADFDVFTYIALAHERGFTGVNISANGPGYRDLGGTTPVHFANVRDCLRDHGMACEIDTSDTRVENLQQMLAVASRVGAERLRVYTKYAAPLQDQIDWTVRDLRAIAPEAEQRGVTIVFENHEDFQGAVISQILGRVDHPRIRALYDYGNSQMVGEEPLQALRDMQPYIDAVHVKDHVLVSSEGRIWVQGVPMGQGLLPIMEQTQALYAGGLRRFCFENVWGYVAPFKADTLPATPAFSLNHPHAFLNGGSLEKPDALAREWQAFESGWQWYQQALGAAGFEIARQSRTAASSESR
jgi:sugar phosphate isomerase/epimerase